MFDTDAVNKVDPPRHGWVHGEIWCSRTRFYLGINFNNFIQETLPSIFFQKRHGPWGGDLDLLIPFDINVCMKWSSGWFGEHRVSRVHVMIVSLATVWICQMTFWLFFKVSKYSIFCERHTFAWFHDVWSLFFCWDFFIIRVRGLLCQASAQMFRMVLRGCVRFESETECCAPAPLCVSKQFHSPDMIPTWRAHTWHYSDTLQMFPDGRKCTGNCFLQEKDTCTYKSF